MTSIESGVSNRCSKYWTEPVPPGVHLGQASAQTISGTVHRGGEWDKLFAWRSIHNRILAEISQTLKNLAEAEKKFFPTVRSSYSWLGPLLYGVAIRTA